MKCFKNNKNAINNVYYQSLKAFGIYILISECLNLTPTFEMSTILMSVCLLLKKMSTIFLSVCLLLKNMCLQCSCPCVYNFHVRLFTWTGCREIDRSSGIYSSMAFTVPWLGNTKGKRAQQAAS